MSSIVNKLEIKLPVLKNEPLTELPPLIDSSAESIIIDSNIGSTMDTHSTTGSIVPSQNSDYVRHDAKNNVAAGVSTFVLAYALHKMIAPLRVGITLTATPFIVRHLRHIGFIKSHSSTHGSKS